MTTPANAFYYAILTFGPIIEGRRRSFYRSEAAARRDAQALVGPSTIRLGRYATRQEAITADISDPSRSIS
jgi:hypothetical protein